MKQTEQPERLEQTQRLGQPDNQALPLLFMATLGLASFWASFFFLLFCPFGSPFIQNLSFAESWHPLLLLTFLASQTILVFVLNIWADYFSTLQGRRIIMGIASAAPLCIGALFVLALGVARTGVEADASPLLVAILLTIWACAGAGLAAVRMLWPELLAGFTQAACSAILCLSALVGAIFYILLQSLHPGVAVVAFLVSPYFGIVVLSLLRRELPPVSFLGRAESKRTTPLFLKTDIFIVFYGAVFGLAVSYLDTLSYSLALVIGIGVALALGAALTLVLLWRTVGKMVHGTVQRILFPVLVIGLLPLPFIDGILYTFCVLLLITSFIVFFLVNLDTQIVVAARFNSSPLFVVGRGGAPILLGMIVGYASGILLGVAPWANNLFVYYIPLALVILLTLCVTFIPFERDRFAEERESAFIHNDQAGRWRRRCEIVIERYGLSAREKEIFMLLAKGRGSDYIQNKLYISIHTVKTHTYNIYKKMEINSREELITLVEEAELSGEDSDAENPRRLDRRPDQVT